MRISMRVDYAIRAMVELAASSETAGGPVKADVIARSQQIPVRFLLEILRELRNAHLVRSHRGALGGYTLGRPGDQISLADVMRAIEGPLVTVHDASLSELRYDGAAAPLLQVWMATRGAVRRVFDHVTIADLVLDRLDESIRLLAKEYVEANDHDAAHRGATQA